MSDTFRIGDASKSHCYICSAPSVAGKLCECFDSVTPKRHYNVHSAARLAELPPNTVVETFVCEECALLGETTASNALHMHVRHGAYKPHRFCASCYDEKKRQNRPKRPRNDKPKQAPARAAAPQQPQQPQPRQYLSDMLAEATASVTSGQA
jgi:hypothetical protein